MESYKAELSRIRGLLRSHVRGLTIIDISRKIGINRNSVAKYLDVLVTAGHAEVKTIGPAKVFFSTHKIPVQALLNLTANYVLVLDRNRQVLFASDNLLTLSGHAKGEVLGKKIDEVPFAFLQDPVLLEHLGRKCEDRTFSAIVPAHTPQGGLLEYSISLIPTMLEDTTCGTSILIRDITAIRQEERHKELLQGQFDALLEDLDEFVCGFTPDGSVTFANEAFCRYLGIPPGDIVGSRLFRFIPPAEREQLDQHLAALSVHTPAGSVEHGVQRADGTPAWHRWTDRAFFDPDGAISFIQSVGRDITEYRRLDPAHALQEERLRRAIAYARIGIWDWDLTQGRVVHQIDPACGECTPSTFQGEVKEFLALLYPEDGAALWKRIETLAEKKSSYFSTEFRVFGPSGDPVWMRGSGEVIRDPVDRPVRIIGTTMNITEQKLLEERLRTTYRKLQDLLTIIPEMPPGPTV
jgi:PAS domain S-box-containing protein